MIAVAGLAHGQIVQSGFESWSGSTPDGWMGAKSNIPASGVTQVTTNPHGGTSAVGLANATTTHKRFTTQPVTVTSGTAYTIDFWVRGSGQIRTSMYDGRATGFGYAPYNSYVTATSTWTEVTQTVVCAMDASDAEFILSVVSTTAPDNIVVDDVTITEVTIPVASIYDIQFTADISGDSPMLGQIVSTGGIVTALLPDSGGYFIQNNTGAWQGVFVYDRDNVPAMGDSLTFTCSVTEFNGLTELASIANYTVVNSGNAGPAPLVVNTGDVSYEAIESVLIKVMDGNCIEAPSGANFGKYKLDDGSGECVVGKVIYTTVPDPVLGTHYNVTGVNYYAFAEYNIEPRMASDVEIAQGIAEVGVLAGSSLFPNPATDVVTLDLGQAAGREVNYTLCDAQGRIVRTGLVTGQRNTLNVGALAAGQYRLTLTTNTFRKSVALNVAR